MGAPVASGVPASSVHPVLVAGLVLWLIAQALPTTHGGYMVVQVVTLLGWAFAIGIGWMSMSLGMGLLGLAGWTANLWLLGALVARCRGKLSLALGLSWVALSCALAEVVFLYLGSGGTHCCDWNAGAGVQIIIEPTWDSIGLGTWFWVASLVLVVASSWWARRRGESQARTSRPPAPHRPLRSPGEDSTHTGRPGMGPGRRRLSASPRPRLRAEPPATRGRWHPRRLATVPAQSGQRRRIRDPE
jgi:hypothetical protein